MPRYGEGGRYNEGLGPKPGSEDYVRDEIARVIVHLIQRATRIPDEKTRRQTLNELKGWGERIQRMDLAQLQSSAGPRMKKYEQYISEQLWEEEDDED